MPKTRIGPFSRDRSITTIDKRTKAGRILRSTLAALKDHVALLIQAASLKATSLYLLSEKLLGGGEIGDSNKQ